MRGLGGKGEKEKKPGEKGKRRLLLLMIIDRSQWQESTFQDYVSGADAPKTTCQEPMPQRLHVRSRRSKTTCQKPMPKNCGKIRYGYHRADALRQPKTLRTTPRYRRKNQERCRQGEHRCAHRRGPRTDHPGQSRPCGRMSARKPHTCASTISGCHTHNSPR